MSAESFWRSPLWVIRFNYDHSARGQARREIEQARFWDSIQVDFQNGQVTLIRKTETIKPQQGTTREYNIPR